MFWPGDFCGACSGVSVAMTLRCLKAMMIMLFGKSQHVDVSHVQVALSSCWGGVNSGLFYCSRLQGVSLQAELCLARAQLLKFVGCYHGHADSYLVQAGSGVATLGLPDSPGVPAASTGADPAALLFQHQ